MSSFFHSVMELVESYVKFGFSGFFGYISIAALTFIVFAIGLTAMIWWELKNKRKVGDEMLGVIILQGMGAALVWPMTQFMVFVGLIMLIGMAFVALPYGILEDIYKNHETKPPS